MTWGGLGDVVSRGVWQEVVSRSSGRELARGGVRCRRADRSASRCAMCARPARPARDEVDDPALGVTWLANADLASTDTFNVSGISCDGSMEFATARRWVLAMNRVDYLGHRDWTLPITPTPSTDSGCSGYNKNGGGHFGIGCTTSPLASLYTSFRLSGAPDTAVAIPDATTGPFEDFQPYMSGRTWTQEPARLNPRAVASRSRSTQDGRAQTPTCSRYMSCQ